MIVSLYYFYTDIGMYISKICWLAIFVALYTSGDFLKMGKSTFQVFFSKVCMAVTQSIKDVLIPF